MPKGVRTPAGPSNHPDCGKPGRGGTERHRKEGTTSCQPCRDATAAARRRYVALRTRLGKRRVPAVGTRRRLQALAAIGWTFGELGQELGGWHATRVQAVSVAEHVFVDTAADVRRLYERLWNTPGTSERGRRRAVRAGWFPPMDWDDDRMDDPDYIPLAQVLWDWDLALEERRRRMDAESQTRRRLTRTEEQLARDRASSTRRKKRFLERKRAQREQAVA